MLEKNLRKSRNQLSEENFTPNMLDALMARDKPLPRRVAIEFVRRVSPRTFWRLKANTLRGNSSETEQALLPLLCRSDRAGIDVGAAAGAYAVQMVDLVSKCVAFEPRAWQAEYLRQLAYYADLSIDVKEIAVSNVNGPVALRIPLEEQGLTTAEADNMLVGADGYAEGRVISVEAAARTLDSYGELAPVGFVKIDVEGHENAVLEGASVMLTRQRPRLLIEAEDRHRPRATEDVFATMSMHGYVGFFIRGRELLPISEFEKAIHQNPRNCDGWKNPGGSRPLYINNFIFVPEEESEVLAGAARELLSRRATRLG